MVHKASYWPDSTGAENRAADMDVFYELSNVLSMRAGMSRR